MKGTRHLSLDNGAALETYTREYSYDASGNLWRQRHVSPSQQCTRCVNPVWFAWVTVLQGGEHGTDEQWPRAAA